MSWSGTGSEGRQDREGAERGCAAVGEPAGLRPSRGGRAARPATPPRPPSPPGVAGVRPRGPTRRRGSRLAAADGLIDDGARRGRDELVEVREVAEGGVPFAVGPRETSRVAGPSARRVVARRPAARPSSVSIGSERNAAEPRRRGRELAKLAQGRPDRREQRGGRPDRLPAAGDCCRDERVVPVDDPVDRDEQGLRAARPVGLGGSHRVCGCPFPPDHNQPRDADHCDGDERRSQASANGAWCAW